MHAVSVPPPSTLSPEHVAAFAEHGYAAVPGLVGAGEVRRLRAAVAQLAASARDLTHDTVRSGVKFQVQTESGRAGEAVSPGVFRKIMYPSRLAPPIMRFRDSRLVRGALHDLGVAAPRCVLDQVNLKVARRGTGFPWHQDALFLAPPHQAVIANHGGVNLVVALDEADERNGGFAVLEGTHRRGPLHFDYDYAGTNAALESYGTKRALAMRPGDVVFFHPYLLHGSGRNESDRDRCLLTLWFIDNR